MSLNYPAFKKETAFKFYSQLSFRLDIKSSIIKTLSLLFSVSYIIQTASFLKQVKILKSCIRSTYIRSRIRIPHVIHRAFIRYKYKIGSHHNSFSNTYTSLASPLMQLKGDKIRTISREFVKLFDVR